MILCTRGQALRIVNNAKLCASDFDAHFGIAKNYKTADVINWTLEQTMYCSLCRDLGKQGPICDECVAREEARRGLDQTKCVDI